MLDSLFTITALVGGTVLGFQFVMMLLGIGHDGSIDGTGGHDWHVGSVDGDISGGVDGDLNVAIDGDVSLGHDAVWDHSTDGGVAHHGTSWFYELLSLRTLAAAFTFFGLVGKTTLAYGHPPFASLVYAILAGLAAMYLVYWLFKLVFKLQNAGNENVRRAVGLPATVYVPIPGGRAGTGKVTFRLQDRTVEYLAVTDDADRLATGEKVLIVGIVNAGTVRVAHKAAPAPAQSSA
jgi:membrane protein implicated in regulation of membrane protease activity